MKIEPSIFFMIIKWTHQALAICVLFSEIEKRLRIKYTIDQYANEKSSE